MLNAGKGHSNGMHSIGIHDTSQRADGCHIVLNVMVSREKNIRAAKYPFSA